MVGGGVEIRSADMSRIANVKAPSAGLETGLPLRFRQPPILRRGGCFVIEMGAGWGTVEGPLRQGPLLATAQDFDDIDIVKVKREWTSPLPSCTATFVKAVSKGPLVVILS